MTARTEETFSVSEGECMSDQPSSVTQTTLIEEKDQHCSDGSEVAVWVVAIVLIILFTVGLWWGVSCWTSNNSCSTSKGGKGKGKSKNKSDNNCFGMLGAGLIWLIVVIIFVCAVYQCRWYAIIAFVILIILIGIIAMVASACNGWNNCDKDYDC